jgi:hypothetical protein
MARAFKKKKNSQRGRFGFQNFKNVLKDYGYYSMMKDVGS